MYEFFLLQLKLSQFKQTWLRDSQLIQLESLEQHKQCLQKKFVIQIYKFEHHNKLRYSLPKNYGNSKPTSYLSRTIREKHLYYYFIYTTTM